MSNELQGLRIVLADDHAVVRLGFRLLLEGVGATVVAEAERGEGAIRLYAEHSPDVLVMDVSMPGIGGLAALERPQFPDFGRTQGEKVRERARWLDEQLAAQPWMAGERFTIADITAFCALEFARGLMKFNAGAEGFAHLQAWRERMAERESARVF